MRHLEVFLLPLLVVVVLSTQDSPGADPASVSSAEMDPSLMDLSPFSQPMSDAWQFDHIFRDDLVLTESHLRALMPFCGLPRLYLSKQEATATPEPIHQAVKLFASFFRFRSDADGVLGADLAFADLYATLNEWNLESRFEALRSFSFINVHQDLIAAIIGHCHGSIAADLRQLASVDSTAVVSYLDQAFPYDYNHHRFLLRSALTSDTTDESSVALIQNLIAACHYTQRPYLCSDYLHHSASRPETKIALLEAILARSESPADRLEPMLVSLEDRLASPGADFDSDQLDADLIYAVLYFAACDHEAAPPTTLSRICAILCHAGVRHRHDLIASVTLHLVRVVRATATEALWACWPEPEAQPPFGLLYRLNADLNGRLESVFADLVAAVAGRIFENGDDDRMEQIRAYLSRSARIRIRPEFLFAGMSTPDTIALVLDLLIGLDLLLSPNQRDFLDDLARFTKPFADEFLARFTLTLQGFKSNPDLDLLPLFAIVFLKRADTDLLHRDGAVELLRAVIPTLDENPAANLIWGPLHGVLARLDLRHLGRVLPVLLPSDTREAEWSLYDRLCARIRDREQRAALYLSALSDPSDVPAWVTHYRLMIMREIDALGTSAFFRVWRPTDDVVAREWRGGILWMLWRERRGRLLKESELIEILHHEFNPIPESELHRLNEMAQSILHLILYLLQAMPEFQWQRAPFIVSFVQQNHSVLFHEMSAKLNNPDLTRAQRKLYASVRHDMLLVMIHVSPLEASRFIRWDLYENRTASSWLHSCLDRFISQYESSSATDDDDLLSKTVYLMAIIPREKPEYTWLQDILLRFPFSQKLRRLAAVLAQVELGSHVRPLLDLVQDIPETELSSDQALRIFTTILPVNGFWSSYDVSRGSKLFRHISMTACEADLHIRRLFESLSFPQLIRIVKTFLSSIQLPDPDRRALGRILMTHLERIAAPDSRQIALLETLMLFDRRRHVTDAYYQQKGFFLLDLRDLQLPAHLFHTMLMTLFKSVSETDLVTLFDEKAFRNRLRLRADDGADCDLIAYVATKTEQSEADLWQMMTSESDPAESSSH